MRPLIDSRLYAKLPQHWPSRCTIMQKLYTESESNQKIQVDSIPVPGMVDLPCRIAPLIQERPTDDEIRTTDIQEVIQRAHVKLNGYHPSILPRDMEALVDGVTWKIRGVEHDGQHFSTRLRVEIIQP